MCMSLAFATEYFALVAVDTRWQFREPGTRRLIGQCDAGGKLRPIPNGWAAALGSAAAAEPALLAVESLGFDDPEALCGALGSLHRGEAPRALGKAGERFHAMIVAAQRHGRRLAAHGVLADGSGYAEDRLYIGYPAGGIGEDWDPAAPEDPDSVCEHMAAVRDFGAVARREEGNLYHVLRTAGELFHRTAGCYATMSAEVEVGLIVPGAVRHYLRAPAARVAEASNTELYALLKAFGPAAFPVFPSEARRAAMRAAVPAVEHVEQLVAA